MEDLKTFETNNSSEELNQECSINELFSTQNKKS